VNILVFVAMTAVVPPQYTAGRPLPAMQIVDDAGRARSLESWKGVPTLLVPIYTRCPLACPMIVSGVKRGTSASRASADSYRVVLFSFDPRDTSADLLAFRERQHVPISWTVARAEPADARRLMEAIDFRWTEDRGSILHPNLVVALTPDLKTASYLFGTDFSAGDIDRALGVARGGHDWIARFGPFALATLLLVAIASAGYLATLTGRNRGPRPEARGL
jgi:cytochrome oxidase Cu insertion factor (SCO1/SenC/PrrC family)